MTNPSTVIGLTGLGMTVSFGLGEIHDAYQYSHHPKESVRRELRDWGILSLVWGSLTAVSIII